MYTAGLMTVDILFCRGCGEHFTYRRTEEYPSLVYNSDVMDGINHIAKKI